MGMIGHLRQVTPDELMKIQSNPASVPDFLHGEILANSANTLAALKRVQEIGMQAMAKGPLTDPEQREEIRARILKELESAGVKVPTDGPDENGLSLEKSWHTLHYLLSGSAEEADSPPGNAILGGKEVGPDLGYGPARFLNPNQVREVAAALKKVSNDDLARRFDLNAMKAAKIYACKDEGELELAQHYFQHVVQYYTEAASRGNAMVLYLD